MRKSLAPFLLLATVASGITTAPEAHAAPANCRTWVIHNGSGAAGQCTRGTGSFRMTVTCTRANGSVYFRYGSWLVAHPYDPSFGSAAVCERQDRMTYRALQKTNGIPNP